MSSNPRPLPHSLQLRGVNRTPNAAVSKVTAEPQLSLPQDSNPRDPSPSRLPPKPSREFRVAGPSTSIAVTTVEASTSAEFSTLTAHPTAAVSLERTNKATRKASWLSLRGTPRSKEKLKERAVEDQGDKPNDARSDVLTLNSPPNWPCHTLPVDDNLIQPLSVSPEAVPPQPLIQSSLPPMQPQASSPTESTATLLTSPPNTPARTKWFHSLRKPSSSSRNPNPQSTPSTKTARPPIPRFTPPSSPPNESTTEPASDGDAVPHAAPEQSARPPEPTPTKSVQCTAAVSADVPTPTVTTPPSDQISNAIVSATPPPSPPVMEDAVRNVSSNQLSESRPTQAASTSSTPNPPASPAPRRGWFSSKTSLISSSANISRTSLLSASANASNTSLASQPIDEMEASTLTIRPTTSTTSQPKEALQTSQTSQAATTPSTLNTYSSISSTFIVSSTDHQPGSVAISQSASEDSVASSSTLRPPVHSITLNSATANTVKYSFSIPLLGRRSNKARLADIVDAVGQMEGLGTDGQGRTTGRSGIQSPKDGEVDSKFGSKESLLLDSIPPTPVKAATSTDLGQPSIHSAMAADSEELGINSKDDDSTPVQTPAPAQSSAPYSWWSYVGLGGSAPPVPTESSDPKSPEIASSTQTTAPAEPEPPIVTNGPVPAQPDQAPPLPPVPPPPIDIPTPPAPPADSSQSATSIKSGTPTSWIGPLWAWAYPPIHPLHPENGANDNTHAKTEAELVKEEALARLESIAETSATSNDIPINQSTQPVDELPRPQTPPHLEAPPLLPPAPVNPIVTSTSSSIWTSLFARSRMGATRAIDSGSSIADRNGSAMEVMELDEDELNQVQAAQHDNNSAIRPAPDGDSSAKATVVDPKTPVKGKGSLPTSTSLSSTPAITGILSSWNGSVVPSPVVASTPRSRKNSVAEPRGRTVSGPTKSGKDTNGGKVDKGPAPPLTNSDTIKKQTVGGGSGSSTPIKPGKQAPASAPSSRTGSPAPSSKRQAQYQQQKIPNFVLPTFGDTFFTLPRCVPPSHPAGSIVRKPTSRSGSMSLTKKALGVVSGLMFGSGTAKKEAPPPERVPSEEMIRYLEEKRDRAQKAWDLKHNVRTTASPILSPSENSSTSSIISQSGRAPSVSSANSAPAALGPSPKTDHRSSDAASTLSLGISRIAHVQGGGHGHHFSPLLNINPPQPQYPTTIPSPARHVGKDLPRLWTVLGQERLGGLAGGDISLVGGVPTSPSIDRAGLKVVVIGIHGWFPGAVIRTMLGEPTGTSSKFASMMGAAVDRYVEEHNIPMAKLTLINLEGEGTIARRVAKLYQDLLDHPSWVQDVHEADMVFFATHSQGSIVSTELIASLVQDGHLRTEHNAEAVLQTVGTNELKPPQRILCLALCGIHLGPLLYLNTGSLTQPYFTYFESAAARELFEFQDTSSDVSTRYVASLGIALDHGVKFVYIASLDDQVVPIYSGAFVTASHPLMLRALYIDGDAYSTSDFLSNLIVFLLRVRNAGLDDGGLITHLSESTAGSLSGIGHSTPYLNDGCYELAVRFLFETSGAIGVERPVLRVDPFQARATRNDYEIPWALRGVISDPAILTLFASEIAELRQAFDEWAPKTSILKDLRRKLEPIQSLRILPPSPLALHGSQPAEDEPDSPPLLTPRAGSNRISKL